MTDVDTPEQAPTPPQRRHWTAPLALLDQPSVDGRWLDPDGLWSLSEGAPVILDGATVGRVLRVAPGPGTARRQLRGFGIVDDPEAAQAMERGELRPQVELYSDRHTYTDELLRFHGGRFVAVRLGQQPVWPDLTFLVGSTYEEAVAADPAGWAEALAGDVGADARPSVPAEPGWQPARAAPRQRSTTQARPWPG